MPSPARLTRRVAKRNGIAAPVSPKIGRTPGREWLSFGALVGQVTGVLSVRQAFPWKSLSPFSAGGASGVPLGLASSPS
ncbi:hypothetical protein OY671_012516, partial [Metschnikowia pulcherrima]